MDRAQTPPDATTDADDRDDHAFERRRTVQRTPHPTADYGTLLHLVQLARYRDNAGSNSRERTRACLTARTHGSLLLSTAVSESVIHYVRTSPNPWDLIVDHIDRALGRPSRCGRGSRNQHSGARAKHPDMVRRLHALTDHAVPS